MNSTNVELKFNFDFCYLCLDYFIKLEKNEK